MVEEHEEDQDSLFGSPPPSPRISPHRAQSPPLSLPSANICDSERRLSISTDTQNVGTIALPGSLPYSELPINPLALSLNHSVVRRPPAQSQGQPSVPTTSQQIQPSTIQPSRPHPSPIPKSSSTKGSKNSHQSSQSHLYNDSPSQSRDPELSLPDPSLHPPHFLRNQHNLLGKAGLVAGVNPAAIRHIPGTTFSNPIIVDDEDTPILGRQFLFRDPNNRYVNPSLLSVPTNEDIVSVLIGQKDIFPVLEGILHLLGKGATRKGRTPRRDNPPPVKKRKLNRVPAGATDWDVPYPFQDGEGPDEYHKTWERERGKHLVTQLVKLIKGAARKAATKNYLQKEQARQAAWEKLQQEMMGLEPVMKKDMTVNNHYKPQTITYGLTGAEAQKAMSQVFDVVADTSNDLRPPESNATQNVPFPLTNQFASSPSQLSFDNLNYQSQFNVWMNFLQTFPVAFDAQPQPQSNTTSSQESTPGLDDFAFTDTTGNNFDFGAANMEESSSTSNKTAVPDDLEALISSMMDSLSQDVESTRGSSSAGMVVDPQQPSLIRDDAIDPSLWGPSVQPGSDAANGNLSISQSVSPVPSISSSGSIDPMTPVSSAWEISVPEMFMGGVSGGDGGQGMFRHTLWENFSHGVRQEGSTSGRGEGGQITGDSLSRIVPPEGNMMGGGKGKRKEMNPLGFLSADATPSTQGQDASEAVMSVPVAPSKNFTISKSRKEEILRRAREKRMQIQEELDRVKTQLWETTIEQAALVHLLKRYEND